MNNICSNSRLVCLCTLPASISCDSGSKPDWLWCLCLSTFSQSAPLFAPHRCSFCAIVGQSPWNQLTFYDFLIYFQIDGFYLLEQWCPDQIETYSLTFFFHKLTLSDISYFRVHSISIGLYSLSIGVPLLLPIQ